MMRRTTCLSGCFLLALLLLGAGCSRAGGTAPAFLESPTPPEAPASTEATYSPESPTAPAQLSEQGLFRVTFQSEQSPVPFDEPHDWRLHVETADGKPVERAEIELSGGMPDHDHGLEAGTRVGAYLGQGDYRVEGVHFDMPGAWQFDFTIRAGGLVDRVTIFLDLYFQ
jgi:hypothetical protein